jgi:DNA-binding MarR family transcriptional regulator
LAKASRGKIAAAAPRVKRLDLKGLDPLDPALAAMYFGLKGMTREADAYLATLGLSRGHHRILYVIRRREGIAVGDLVTSLGISKQALHPQMKQLVDAGYVEASRDPKRHRFKLLKLSEMGAAVEQRASDFERAVMTMAFAQAGPKGAKAWSAIMAAIAEHA